MAYEAIVNDVDYTTISWVLIGPIWGLLAGLWLLARRWPMAAAVPAGWLAIIAGLYFSDVYGQFPATLLFLFAAAVVLLPDSKANASPTHSDLERVPEHQAG